MAGIFFCKLTSRTSANDWEGRGRLIIFFVNWVKTPSVNASVARVTSTKLRIRKFPRHKRTSIAIARIGSQTLEFVKVAINQSRNGFVHSRLIKRSRVLSMRAAPDARKLKTPHRWNKQRNLF